MLVANLDTYGGAGGGLTNAQPVEDPTSELDASYYLKLINDVAQMTGTTCRAILLFPTVAAGISTPSATKTLWGDTNAVFPTTVSRTGAGAYTITYPSTFDDLLGNSETLSFFDAFGSVRSTTVKGLVQCTASGATVSVQIYDSTFTASDLTVGTTISVYIF